MFFDAHVPPIVLSTGPGRQATHWKQTVLYFEGSFPAHVGDQLTGTLGLRKNASNPRDLDVKLHLDL